MPEMTLAEEEAYVRARWVDVCFGVMIFFSGKWHSFDDWHSAYLFTVQQETEIADLKEEVRFVDGLLDSWMSPGNDYGGTVSMGRILAREQAALAELRRGMKEQG